MDPVNDPVRHVVEPQKDGVADHGGTPNNQLAPWVARARKFLVGVAGLGAQVITSGALDDAEDTGIRLWVQAGLAVLTAAGIYGVPNAQNKSTNV